MRDTAGAGDVCVTGMAGFWHACAVAAGHGSALCHALQRSTTGMSASLDMQCKPQQLVCPSSPARRASALPMKSSSTATARLAAGQTRCLRHPRWMPPSKARVSENWTRVPRLGWAGLAHSCWLAPVAGQRPYQAACTTYGWMAA